MSYCKLSDALQIDRDTKGYNQSSGLRGGLVEEETEMLGSVSYESMKKLLRLQQEEGVWIGRPSLHNKN